jgi:hypothetical protein
MMYTIDSSSLTILAMVSAGVGFAFGALVMLFFRPKGSDDRAPRKGLAQAARLWRSKASGALVVEMDEGVYEAGGRIPGESKTALRQLTRDLSQWLNEPVQAAPVAPSINGKAAGQPAAIPGSVQPAMTAVEDPPAMAAAESIPSPLTGRIDDGDPAASAWSGIPPVEDQPAAQKPRLSLTRTIQTVLQSEIKVERAAPSIAAQVDEILQENLLGTPLEKRGIRLMELPVKGMVVLVGLEQYGSVDEVPDPEIKAALKTAVAQWERKMLG